MKKISYRTGLAAGALYRVALRLKGYSIVAACYRSPLGEIDIIARHRHFNKHQLHFDVMLVAPWCWPVHIMDAWRPE